MANHLLLLFMGPLSRHLIDTFSGEDKVARGFVTRIVFRLPLSGSRRIFRCDGRDDAIRGLLNVLKALQEKFGISAVEADVVLRGSSGFKAYR